MAGIFPAACGVLRKRRPQGAVMRSGEYPAPWGGEVYSKARADNLFWPGIAILLRPIAVRSAAALCVSGGQNPQRRHAGRPSGGAVDRVRTGCQPEDRESTRHHHPSVHLAACGPGDRMNAATAIACAHAGCTAAAKPGTRSGHTSFLDAGLLVVCCTSPIASVVVYWCVEYAT